MNQPRVQLIKLLVMSFEERITKMSDHLEFNFNFLSIAQCHETLRCFSCNESLGNINTCNEVFKNGVTESVDPRFLKKCPVKTTGCFMVKTSVKENPSELLLLSFNHTTMKKYNVVSFQSCYPWVVLLQTLMSDHTSAKKQSSATTDTMYVKKLFSLQRCIN